MSLNIAIIYGSVRSNRQGIKAARFIFRQCQARAWQVTLIDPLEHKLPLLDKRYMDYEEGQAPNNLENLATILRKADAYIIVSGEYNHNIPPALANILDHFKDEFNFKPAGIITYSSGAFGGIRVVSTLRDMLATLGMASVPITLPISKVQDFFSEDGTALDKNYEARAARFLDEFVRYAEALKNARHNKKL